MTALRAVAWLSGDQDAAERYSCRICETQKTIPPRKALLGCDEPIDTATWKDGERPGARGPNRELHVGPVGFRSWRCPRAWANDPIAVECWAAYRWWEAGQLALRYAPDPVPSKVVEAIDIVRVTHHTAEHQYFERHRQKPGG